MFQLQAPTLFSVNNLDIKPSTFVKLRPAGGNDYGVMPCGLGDVAIGITQRGSAQPYGVMGSSNLAAISTTTQSNATQPQHINVYPPGYKADLLAGAAWNTGDFLMPDANSAGIPCYNGMVPSAIALEAAPGAGYIAEVLTLPPGAYKKNVLSKAAAYNLAVSDSEAWFFVTAADVVLTLPAVAGSAGVRYRVVSAATTAALQAGTTGVAVAPQAGEQVKSSVIATPANGKVVVNTKATATQGDSVELYCDGSVWWAFVTSGTWTRQA